MLYHILSLGVSHTVFLRSQRPRALFAWGIGSKGEPPPSRASGALRQLLYFRLISRRRGARCALAFFAALILSPFSRA